MIRYIVVHKTHLETFLRAELRERRRDAIKHFIEDNQYKHIGWVGAKKAGWVCRKVKIEYCN